MQQKTKNVFDRLKDEALHPERRLAVLWIPAISMVPVANLLILRGWREEVLQRLSDDEDTLLPEPELGRFLVRGAKSWTVTLAFVALPIAFALVMLPDLRLTLRTLYDVLAAGPEVWWSLAVVLFAMLAEEPLRWASEIPWPSLLAQAAFAASLFGLVLLLDHLSAACSAAFGSSRLALNRAVKTSVAHPNAVLAGVGLRFAVLGGLALCTVICALAGPALLVMVLFGPGIYYFLTTATLGELVWGLARAQALVEAPSAAESARAEAPSTAVARVEEGV